MERIEIWHNNCDSRQSPTSRQSMDIGDTVAPSSLYKLQSQIQDHKYECRGNDGYGRDLAPCQLINKIISLWTLEGASIQYDTTTFQEHP